jgi:hypothetical protein
MEMKWRLHQLMEKMRDFLGDSIRRRNIKSSTKKNPLKSREEGQFLRGLSTDICEHVQAYFRELTTDETIGCAIRLGVPAQSGVINFETVGRSDGLSPGREKTTQAIPSDQGVPNFFVSEHNSRGLLYYYNIPLAIEKGAFIKTKSEDSYASDISTMVVAPLRGWNGNSVGLLGLLYITSRRGNTFDMKQFDSIGCIADSVTTVFVAYLNQLESSSVIPELSA